MFIFFWKAEFWNENVVNALCYTNLKGNILTSGVTEFCNDGNGCWDG